MPVYEFYCAQCHTIYNFWSQKINTVKRPACPRCDNQHLQRRMSKSAIISGGKSSGEDELDQLPIDESNMEAAMLSLASEAEHMDEDNPRQMAQLMRKFSAKTGLKYNDQLEEALARLEAGEDPDQIEAELGDILDGDELPFELGSQKGLPKDKVTPQHDETLYDLDKY